MKTDSFVCQDCNKVWHSAAYIADKPEECPDCGGQLVPVEEGEKKP